MASWTWIPEPRDRVIDEQLAVSLGLDTQTAAWGVHEVANANMEQALRSMSIERGRDPREFTLVAFGGAGPLHACRLARALEIPQVIVPFGAGVGSAIGMLAAEPRLTTAITHILPMDSGSPETLHQLFGDLESRTLGMLAEVPARWIRHGYLRYHGQGYELRVELPEGDIERAYIDEVLARFHRAYRDAYGYDQPDQPVEATEWHLTAVTAGTHTLPALKPAPSQTPAGQAKRPAYFPERNGMVDCDIYDRLGLGAGKVIEGPALIADPDSTTLVLPGDTATVDESGHLDIAINALIS